MGRESMNDNFTASMRRQLAAALGIAIVLPAMSFAKADNTPQDSSSLNGTWQLADAKAEGKTRQDAIAKALEKAPRIARSRAAKMLQDSTKTATKLEIEDQGDRVLLTQDKKQFNLVLGGKPIEVILDSGKVSLTAEHKKQLLVVTAKTSNATRTTMYRPSKDGKTLVVEASVSVPRLSATVRYQTKYVRP